MQEKAMNTPWCYTVSEDGACICQLYALDNQYGYGRQQAQIDI